MDSRKIQQALDLFSPITLDEMREIRLMNRIDTKYVTTLPKLLSWLQEASSHYFVQEMEGCRILPYHTIYYDTPDRGFYLEHHNGRLHRQKVRFREYEINHLMFLEVKEKNNHGRTHKKRIPVPSLEFTSLTQRNWVDDLIRSNAFHLKQQVENRFSRITLVNLEKTERLTIDLDLKFHNLTTGRNCSLPEHVIIELKRDGDTPSPAIGLLQHYTIRPCGFSKYCIGMALTDPQLKQNQFKEKIHYLHKLGKVNN